MKKALALLLCLMMMLTLSVGCKKNQEAKKTGDLTETQISSDLLNSDNLYRYAHTGDITSIAGLQVNDKKEDGNTITLTATATAGSDHISIALTANMKYMAENGAWKLDTVEITKADPTVIAGPYKDTLVNEVNNYINLNRSSQDAGKTLALAYYGEERHSLNVNTGSITWGIAYEKGNTAKLTAEMKSDALTFSGYYNLTFDKERGWLIESELQEHGQSYLVLHLDTLEQKTADEK